MVFNLSTRVLCIFASIDITFVNICKKYCLWSIAFNKTKHKKKYIMKEENGKIEEKKSSKGASFAFHLYSKYQSAIIMMTMFCFVCFAQQCGCCFIFTYGIFNLSLIFGCCAGTRIIRLIQPVRSAYNHLIILCCF